MVLLLSVELYFHRLFLKSLLNVKLAGAILGRNGVHLKHVCMESGVKVQFGDSLIGTAEPLVMVTGSTEQVENAHLLF